jgi:hypothetical protein
MNHVGLIQVEQDMNTGGRNIGIHDTNTKSIHGEQCSYIRRGVGFSRPAAKRVN